MLFFIISFIVYWGRLRREIWQNLIQIEKIISHTENSIFITHTDLTDRTDFYIPLNSLIFCPAEMNSLIHLTSFYLIN